MAVIEKHIHEHFASLAEGVATEETTTTGLPSTLRGPLPPPPQQIILPVFAKVNSVATGGPADSAGMKAGDEIRNFGYVNHSTHDGLRRVGECVQGNEGVSYYLLVLN
jgi:26S proteasome regulatory subunit N4